MSVNVVVLAGNTTKDMEVRRTPSGMPVVMFGLAVNERKRNPQTGEWDDVANFFDVTAFGERWEKLAQFVPKGSKVTVKGKLRYSTWEKDGQRRSKVDVVADEIEPPAKNKQPQQSHQSYGYSQPQYVEASIYDDDLPF